MFSISNLMAGAVFGAIGWGAVVYGRKLDLWKPIAIGLAMMIYPYFFSNAVLTWSIGFALLLTLWFHHDE